MIVQVSSSSQRVQDIRSFNLALLAKQGWRLLTNPNSLLFQVYKARYFQDGSFLSAQLGSRPSATWRGIWMAKRYLNMEQRCRVGNGNGISIWADPWIPNYVNFKIITPRPYHLGFSYAVLDLIGPISRNWNKELISAHFQEVDRTRILQIPIGATTQEISQRGTTPKMQLSRCRLVTI